MTEILPAHAAPAEQLQLRFAQAFSPPRALLQAAIVFDHQIARCQIGDRPQAEHLRFRPSQHQRAPQAINALARLHFADSRITGRQHDELRTP